MARAYEGGRLLLIGTTNLDAQVPVLWNIGAIAASGHPDALDLVRKILRASSAVPGVFQPVLFDIELDGQHYQELHVDGGAIAQMFLYPPTIDVRQQAARERKAYLIRNARQDPKWADVEPRTFSIAGRAISTMIHSSGTQRYRAHLLHHPARRRRLQPRLHRQRLRRAASRRFRHGLHELVVRLWLPAGARRLRLEEGTAGAERVGETIGDRLRHRSAVFGAHESQRRLRKPSSPLAIAISRGSVGGRGFQGVRLASSRRAPSAVTMKSSLP